MTEDVLLRTVEEGDLPVFFEHMRDPDANRMAAFTAKDPNDRDAFDAKWAKILTDETVVPRTIEFAGEIAGHIARFELHGKPQITYWIDRRFWGKGLATKALSKFLVELTERPLYASAAADNLGSLRVLQKCGFVVTGSESAFANGRGEDIEEVFLELR